jgi:hypothetical protein
MDDQERYDYYADPEHRRPAPGPVYKRVRPGVTEIRYEPAERGPQTSTVNWGMRPFFQQVGTIS